MKKGRTYDFTYTYINQKNRDSMALALINTAIKYFNKAYIIKHFKDFEEKITKQFANKGKGAPNWQDFSGFLKENLIDQIKILICFENYFKAILIKKGYLVHNLDGKSKKELKKHGVKIEPLKTAIFKKYFAYKQNPDNGHFYLEGIKETTVNINKVLTHSEYIKILNLPENIRQILINIKKHRNSLHFKIGDGMSCGSQMVKKTKSLINFVNNSIEKQRKTLSNKTKKS